MPVGQTIPLHSAVEVNTSVKECFMKSSLLWFDSLGQIIREDPLDFMTFLLLYASIVGKIVQL